MVLRFTSETVSHNALGNAALFSVLYLLEYLVVALYPLEDLAVGLYLLEDLVVKHLPQVAEHLPPEVEHLAQKDKNRRP